MTYQELKEAGFVRHDHCAACGVPVGYRIHSDLAAAVFDSGCDCGCGSGSGSDLRILTHAELAEIKCEQKESGE